jgi:LuxR family maltose regulon positive regulatory protein
LSYIKNNDDVLVFALITEATVLEEPGAHAEILSPTLVPTKIRRPKVLSDTIPRPHLAEQLNLGLSHSLILVAAPAGYGKTTLVSSWLEASDCSSAWLTLDETDNDLALFLSTFIIALNQILPDACPSTNDMVQRASLPPLPLLSASLIKELDAALPSTETADEFVFVFDDYHHIRNADIHKLLTELLRHPLPGFHLVIVSRRDPSLGLSRLRAQSRLVEFRVEELRFDETEIKALMERLLKQKVDNKILKTLEERTEGWVTGLRLAALSARKPADLTRVFDALRPDSRYVMDYLVDEVLQRQSIDVQRFLLCTSVLERFTPSLAGELMEVQQAEAYARQQLIEIQKANLFLVPLDDEGEWYRYHHLFQELLKHRLQTQYTPEQIVDLYLRSSAWFAQNGYIDEALRYALIGGDVDGAARLVEAQRLPAMNQERWQRLQRWLKRLPPDIVQKRPNLLMAQAWLMSTKFRLDEITPIVDQVESQLKEPGLDLSSSDRQMLQGEIALFRGQHAYFQGKGQICSNFAEAALVDLPLRHSLGRGYAYLFRAGGRQLSGDLEGGYAVLREALAEDRVHRNVFPARPLFGLEVFDYISLDFTALERTSAHMLRLAEERSLPESAGWAHLYRGCLHYKRNDLDLAEEAFLNVVEERYRIFNRIAMSGYCGLALTYQALGRPGEARQTVEAALTFDLELGLTGARIVTEAVKAQLALMQGDLNTAIRWVAAFDRQMALRFMTYYSAPHLMLPRILIAQGTGESLKEAAELLPRMLRFARDICNSLDVAELLALEALLYDAQGLSDASFIPLEKALELAQREGLLRIFVELGPQMGRLLHQLTSQASLDSELRTFAGQILSILGDADRLGTQLHISANEQASILAPLTPRELEVLQLLGERLTNREIALRLVISILTVKRHTVNIYDKLDVSGRRDAVAKAQGIGLLPPD